MAYAPLNYDYHANGLLGVFTEREYGKRFDYVKNPEIVYHVQAHGGNNVLFPHLIFVGPKGEETRRALVKETVAHVVTDERSTADGRSFFVVEKWNIKDHGRHWS